MNPFVGLPEFLAVAETRGFASAARRLGVSTSHVSRQIAALEERLGVWLVARTTRSVSLTEIGEEYYERGMELLQGLSEANRIATGEGALLQGRVRISASADAVDLLAPALVLFAKEHPQLELDLDFSPRLVNLLEEGFDLAIRHGALSDSGLIVHKLAESPVVAAAAPEYLRQHGTPRAPADLRKHACLIAGTDRWSFHGAEGPIEVRVSGRWRSNSKPATVAACRAGLGIAYLPRVSYEGALDEGALRAVLEKHRPPVITTWLVYPTRRFMPARTRRVIDFLLEHFRTWRPRGQKTS